MTQAGAVEIQHKAKNCAHISDSHSNGKQRVFAKFMNCVAKEAATEMAPVVAEVVVAYGASKFAPGGKGEIAVSTSRSYQA
ncbi:hypothetical protein CXG81DRAFT_28407 [Caulochytrium protostelioides]|uniref:Uncharacterized protein n=1 Tax=Caulochytrium protostelioides TaxID=1555241 RepID=A0A4P9X1M3_9FUNG|nr:hypothetical protein CXG81DRAFT_28407 [Caulochytrium protostelioides]|eukprot:RKO98788.1 hypothetical protein CXG81DRAFT_28407 [Caulochytrium protostelioides]